MSLPPALKLDLPLAIVGLGISGKSIQRLLLLAGVPTEKISLFDDKPAADVFADPLELMEKAKPRTLIVSPGYPLQTAWLLDAQARGLSITSELEVALSFLTTEKIIGVTGSVGKSTTVSLLESALHSFSSQFFVGGNLGVPLSDYVASAYFRGRVRADWVVLELSSYQLELCKGLSCEHAAITYLTRNHLERYPDLDSYYQTKWKLFEQTVGERIANRNGGDLYAFSQGQNQVQKVKPVGKSITWTDRNDPEIHSYLALGFQLIGLHNQDNIALAIRLAMAAQWPKTALNALLRFPGLPHRLENCGVLSGVLFINDSKATTMSSVLEAVQSVLSLPRRPRKIHLLLGGRDKNLPWHELHALADESLIQALFFGEFGTQATVQSGLSGEVFKSLQIALEKLASKTKKGDVVLLSPGGVSQDEFLNFEDRGNFFKKKILEYWQSSNH